MDIQGMTALVTGGAKGLGRMTALTLARMGCHIAVNYRNSRAEAEALAEEIRRLGAECLTVQADITVRDDIHRLAAACSERFGGVDILVNNAGPFVYKRVAVADYAPEALEQLLYGNLFGVLELDRLIIPHMRQKGYGRILHFGFSHAGEARGWPHRGPYAAAKVGLVSLTKTMAAEEAQYGITVNMICPGDVRDPYKEAEIRQVRSVADEEIPRGRPGSGEDIARVIGFLCQPDSDFVTGNIIDIHGGLDPIRSLPYHSQRMY